jgi:hypothetical protein
MVCVTVCVAAVLQFTREVKFRVHVVSTMAPSAHRCSRILSTIPDLVQLATPMYFHPWPPQALEAVAHHVLSMELPLLAHLSTEHVRDSLADDDIEDVRSVDGNRGMCTHGVSRLLLGGCA